jgi:hypothetical protein
LWRRDVLTSESSSKDAQDVASTKFVAAADQVPNTVVFTVSCASFIKVNISIPKEDTSAEVGSFSSGIMVGSGG